MEKPHNFSRQPTIIIQIQDQRCYGNWEKSQGSGLVVADVQPAFNQPEFLSLYREVTQSPKGVPPQKIDQSLPAIDYNQNVPGKATKPDGWVQTEELFHVLTIKPSLRGIYRRFAGEPLPWEPSDTPYNRKVLKVFDQLVKEYRETHFDEAPRSLGLAKEIFSWILRDRSEGGLGMKYEFSQPEFNFDQAVRTGKSNCSEDTYLLMAFFSRAGFQKVEPEWVGEESATGERILHVVARLELEGKSYLMDLTAKKFNVPQAGYVPMARYQLLAGYWSNRANNETNRATQKKYLDLALAIDPSNPFIRINLGSYYLKNKDYGKAEEEYRKVQKMYPRLWQPYLALGNLRNYQKRHKEAVKFYRMAVKFNPNDFDSRKGLVNSLIGTGNKAEVQKELDGFVKFLKERKLYLDPMRVPQLRLWVAAQQNIINSL